MSMRLMKLNAKLYSESKKTSFKCRLNRLVFGCPKINNLDFKFK